MSVHAPDLMVQVLAAFTSRTMRLIKDKGRLPLAVTGISSTVTPPMMAMRGLRLARGLRRVVLERGISFMAH
jgi:hypothetical protein